MQGAALLLQHDVRHGVATMPSWRTRSPPEKGYSVKEEDYPANKCATTLSLLCKPVCTEFMGLINHE